MVIAQGKTSIPGVDDGEELELCDVIMIQGQWTGLPYIELTFFRPIDNFPRIEKLLKNIFIAKIE